MTEANYPPPFKYAVQWKQCLKRFLLAIAVFFLALKASAQHWAFWNSSNSNLPNTTITEIAADSSGNIWISTYDGVGKYSNGSWQIFNTSNSPLPSNVCYSIATEGNTVWIGTVNGLVKFDGNSSWVTYHTLNSGLPYHYIVSIDVDRHGVKWIGTIHPFGGHPGGGVTRFDNFSWVTYDDTNSGLNSNYAFNTYVDHLNRKWIGTINGLNVYNDTVWTKIYATSSGLASNTVTAVRQDQDHIYWIGTEGGLNTYDEIANDWHTYDSSNTGIPNNYFSDLEFDDSGKLWFALFGLGLGSFDGVSWNYFDSASTGLNITYPYDIEVTGTNVWLVYGSGVYFYGDTSVLNSISNIEDIDFVIYPNPASNLMYIQSATFARSYMLTITDVAGKTIREMEYRGAPFSIAELPSGYYFLTLSGSGHRITKPFLKI